MSTPSRLTGRQIPGKSVPFFERVDPSSIPEILASEHGVKRSGIVLRASQVKAITPGQILGRVTATGKYVAVKSGSIKTAEADTTLVDTIVLSGRPAFEAGDVITITKVSGTASKTISTVTYDSGDDETTIVLTAAIGAGAIAVGGRVYTSAATGGTGIAIASEYHEVTDYEQQEAAYISGSFRKARLTDWTSDIATDFGARANGHVQEPSYLGDSAMEVVTIF